MNMRFFSFFFFSFRLVSETFSIKPDQFYQLSTEKNFTLKFRKFAK